jgi:hypothetical protein
MRPENKPSLLHWLDAIQNNFMVGMAASYVFERSETWGLLDGARVGFLPAGAEPKEENLSFNLPVYHVGSALRDETLRAGLLLDFRNMLFRALLSETMEHVGEYCRGTNQSATLLKSAWFNFARVLRNAETHDGAVHFDKKAVPPVVFQKWRLEASDDGKRLRDLIGIPNTTSIAIIESARTFVNEELS